MKKSKGHSWKIIAGVAGAALILAIGFGAGTILGEKKAATTKNTEAKSSNENDKKQATTEIKKNPADSQKNTENQTAEKDSSNQSNDQTGEQQKGNTTILDGAAVYDAAIPEESPAIHRYEFIRSDSSWTTAYQDCLDRGGYLVRINDESEYEYLRKEIVKQGMTNVFFRLGGKRDRSNQDYHWVNQSGVLFGETLNSENSWCSDAWGQDEPTFKDGNLEETYMDLFFSDKEKRFIWNDVPNDMLEAEPAYAGSLGYICEYE